MPQLTEQFIDELIKDEKKLQKFVSELESIWDVKNRYNELVDTNKRYSIKSPQEMKNAKIKYKADIQSLKKYIVEINTIFKNVLVNKTEKEAKHITKVWNGIIEYIKYHNSKCHKGFIFDQDEYNRLKQKPILFVRNLTKFYRKKQTPTVSGLSFDVWPGEFHAFIGANGSEKTSTIKSLITFYYRWSGTILINCIKNETIEGKKKIGYIPEKANFPEHFSTLSYLKSMASLSGLSEQEAQKVALNKLKELGMSNLAKRSPNTFSSGQKKKILLAQALIHDPDIIIMDEPVANLDPTSRIDFFKTLVELKKHGKAIFISSHVLAELDLYADSLTILDGGKIVYSGKKDKLLSEFNNNEFTICVEPKNSDALVNVLKTNNVKITKQNPQKGLFNFASSNNKQIEQIQKSLLAKKIFISSFNTAKPTLDDIYNKLVIKGSIDTMYENQAIKKNSTCKN